MQSRTHSLPTCLLAIAVGAAALACCRAHAADAPPAPAASAGPPSEAATRAQLAAVRAQLVRIAQAQRATAAERDAINAKLAEQAGELSATADALRDTDAGIATQTETLAGLQSRRAQLEGKLASQRAALADLLRAVYTLDQGSDVSLLLGDEDLAKIDRALAYSRYFQRDRIARIRGLLGELAQMDKLGASIASATAALQQQRQQRAAQAAQLEQARDAQRKLLAEADARLSRQKDKLASLQHDAQALDRLLRQLQNVFADIPPQIGSDKPFAQLRGQLPQPVAGTPREGTGTLAHGIVIAARPGAEVRAVAYGRVAWADFMRGYGMLVIIDQGEGWMSLYGGNEAALVSAGDWVKPGQVIATVSRDPEQGGAWFGLRHAGQPVDPRGWFAAKH